eukprot:Clim_evm12s46 gene=Clim_evmTU12s46
MTKKRKDAEPSCTQDHRESDNGQKSTGKKRFTDLGLSAWLCQQLRSLGLSYPTDVQKACIPQVLAGRSVIGGAKTGSGKTMAFALPILDAFAKDPFGYYAVVLTPTRELAFQIDEQFRAVGGSIQLRTVVIVGGMDMMTQGLQLSKKPHIIIATPGRLADHINSGATREMTLQRSRFLVLDEADRLLSSTFARDLRTIFDAMGDSSMRQKLLFSATVSDPMRDYAKAIKSSAKALGETKKQPVLSKTTPQINTKASELFMHDPAVEEVTVEKLEQEYMLVPVNVKEATLLVELEAMEGKDVIVFVETTRACEVIGRTMRELGQRCTMLHSRLSQNERLSSLAKFKSQIVKILIATDVAARGLDIPTVAAVINYDLPRDPDDYVHRVGRTARAGRKGQAISFTSQFDIDRIQAIEERIGKEITERSYPESEIVKVLKLVFEQRQKVIIDLDREGFEDKRRLRNKKRKMLKE